MSGSSSNSEWLHAELCDALAKLAAPAAEQLADLGRVGGEATPVDELALSLDDVAEAAASAEGLLTVEQRRLLDELVDQLTMMSGPAHERLWTPKALESAAEWNEVRTRASRALAAIGPPA